ncbi:MAG: HAMP domain-containing protein [Chloroflexi bacterium]|nr:MAG: HAMP domain-containing protein [Chloroflexota bacterium]
MSSFAERTRRISPSPRHLFDRFWAVAGAVSVRTKILGIVLALVLILGAGVTVQVRLTLRDSLSQQLQNKGISVARDVAAQSVDMLLVRDLYAVHQLLQDTLANNPEVSYAFVVSPQGEILAHTFGERFPTSLINVNTAEGTDHYQLQKLNTNEGVVWDFAVPIFEGKAGIVRLGLSEDMMHAALDSITGQLLFTTILVSLVAVAAAIFLTWLITRPVLALVDVTKSVAQGDLSRQAPHWADDEIGLLSDSFNAMTKDLAATQAKNQAFNAELIRRNRELAALNIVAQTVSQRQDLHEMLESALRCVLDLMHMQAGWIVLFAANNGKYQLACSIGLPQAIAMQEADRGFLSCQCSRVVDEKSTLLISSLQESCPIYQLKLPNQQTVTGHVAVPLISKSQVLGTLNITCTPDNTSIEEDMQLLEAIGQQLGVAVENARLWREVREKEKARGQLLEKIITAQEEERKRIARELHDGTSQALTSFKVGLKVLERLESPEEIRQHLAGMQDIVAETLDTVHDLALELRPSVLDDLGLVAALHRYVAEYQRRFNLRVDCRAVGFEGRRLPATVETALYRIVQESLTNVARHSGAKYASVTLERTDQYVRAIVEDNGDGFDASQARAERKLGLYGMEERAVLIGGNLRIESVKGEGTTILVHIPLSEIPVPNPEETLLEETI